MSITAADRITATPCPDALAAISGDLWRSSLMAIDREIASLARFVSEPADEVLVEALLERLAIVTALVDGLALLPAGGQRRERAIEAARCAETLLAEASAHPDLLPLINAAARAFIEAHALAPGDDTARLFSAAAVVDSYLGASSSALVELARAMDPARRLRSVVVYTPGGLCTDVLVDGAVAHANLSAVEAKAAMESDREDMLGRRDRLEREVRTSQAAVIGTYERVLSAQAATRVQH